MPVLPDQTSFGARPVPTNENTPVGYQPNQVDQAVGELGGAVAGVGNAINRQNFYEGGLQRAYAQSAVSVRQHDLETQLAQDPDYASIPQKYQEGMQQIISDAGKSVSDPYHQDLFNDWANKIAFGPGQQRMNNVMVARRKDDANGKLEELITTQMDTGLKNPDMAPQALQNMQQAIYATAQNGDMDWTKATKLNQTVANQFSKARLEALPPAQQVAMLQPIIDRMRGNPAAQGDQSVTTMPQGQSPQGGAPQSGQSVSRAPTNSDDAISYVMQKLEGPGYVPNDNGQGPSKWGIVGKWNGLTDDQVKNLTPDKAAQIYKTNYWDAIGADDLPPQMRLAAFDTAVQHGPAVAQKMIDRANGDPNALMADRAGFYQALVNSNPAKYGASADGWNHRMDLLNDTMNGQGRVADQGPTGTIADHLRADQIPEMYERAISKQNSEMVKFRSGLDQRVKDSSSMAMMGTDDPNPPALKDFQAAYGEEAPARFAAFQDQLQYGKDYNALAGMTPDQQQAIIEKNAPQAGPGFDLQQKRYDELNARAGDVNKTRQQDPIAFGLNQGLIDNKPLNFSDPNQFSQQLKDRFNMAQSMSRDFGTPVVPFSKQEAAQFASALDSMPAVGRMSYLRAINQSATSPDAYQAAIQQIRPDSPVTALAGGYMTLDGQTANQGGLFSRLAGNSNSVLFTKVAEQLLKGEDLINPPAQIKGQEGKGTFPMPADQKLQDEFRNYVGDSFRNYPQQEKDAFLAFKANYAALTAQAGSQSEALNTEVSKPALQQVIGVVSRTSSGHVIVPLGMDESTFRDQAKANLPQTLQQAGLDASKWNFSDFGMQNTGSPGAYRLMVGEKYLLDQNGNPVTLRVGNAGTSGK